MEESEAIARQPYISASIIQLSQAVEEIAKMRQDIEGKLSPILRDATPQPDRNESENCGVPLADEISGIARELERSHILFDDLLQRIEL